jgi:hypothetical protein
VRVNLLDLIEPELKIIVALVQTDVTSECEEPLAGLPFIGK